MRGNRTSEGSATPTGINRRHEHLEDSHPPSPTHNLLSGKPAYKNADKDVAVVVDGK